MSVSFFFCIFAALLFARTYNQQAFFLMTAIEFNHVGKQYRLGLVSTGTISHDLNRWWQTSILGKEDPYLKIGDVNDRSAKANSEYVWALRDIDFKVEQGDVVGIIGKNGAGKSTLLKLLSKVTTPTVGTIRARGRIASLLEVGTGFHSEMTGRENIYMNGAILGMTKAEIDRKLDEIVDFSGCEKYIDTPVKRYSSGMTVRLGFAVAAFLDPEILVVDEVLAVGDAEFQKKAIGKMKDVSQGQGRTVLFVSHNMTSVKQLCQHGILLENGEITFMGSAEDTIGRYLSVNLEDLDKPLLERNDREGNGKIRFTNIIFRNAKGDAVTEAFVGTPLTIEMYFQVNDSYVDLSKAIMACNFSDTYGVLVTNWVSDEMNHDFSNLKSEKKIVLQIPALNLRPQTYNFGVQLSIGSTAPQDWCDAVKPAVQLTILNDAIFTPGVNLQEYRGHLALVPAKFI